MCVFKRKDIVAYYFYHTFGHRVHLHIYVTMDINYFLTNKANCPISQIRIEF